MQNNPSLPIIAAIGGMVSAQIGAAIAKSIFPIVGPDAVAALRTTIAAIILYLVTRAWQIRLSRRQMGAMLGYSFTLGAMNLMLYKAIEHIPIGVAISIEVIGPLAVALLASRRAVDIIWILFAATGLVLLPYGAPGGRLDPVGVAFGLGAAACWAVYIVAGKRILGELGNRGVAIGMALSCLVTVPVASVTTDPGLITLHVVMIGGAVALLSSAITYILDAYALRGLPNRVFGVLMSASPAIAALAGFAVLGERLSSIQWAGIFAIAIACAGAALQRRPSREEAIATATGG